MTGPGREASEPQEPVAMVRSALGTIARATLGSSASPQTFMVDDWSPCP